MNTDKVKDKIRKLLALGAADSGATEPERERALAQANLFILKYNLTEDECSQAGEGAPEIIHTIVPFGRFKYIRTVVTAISRLYFCENLIVRNSPDHIIIGRPANVQTVLQVVPFILMSITYESFARYSSNTAMRNDFHLGAARGIYELCARLRRENEAMPHGNGKELVVANMYNQRQLENNGYVAKALGPVTPGKTTKPKANMNADAYFSGKAHGLAAQVTVNIQ